ncbi:MAG: hypothetical protein ACE5DR_05410 [Thermodesulfobacteriota bacterium]
MKRRWITAIAVLTASLFLGPSISTAADINSYPAGTVANGIMTSRHNLGSFGRVLKTDDTTQVCVFCHTPHHANTQASPLWNRDVSNSTNYTAYGQTVAGTTINNADLGGSTSLACLSCHDGATTFDSLVNAPGKGGYVAGGTDLNWAFDMPNFNFNATTYDHFGNASLPNAGCLFCHNTGAPLFATGDTVGSLVLDYDLTNDHPISVPYSSSKASLRPVSTVIGTINLSAGLANTTAFYTNISQNRWAVSGFISSTATIGEILRRGKVECSTCHDPHFRNLSWDESDSTYQYANKTPNPSIPQAWCTGEACSDGLFLRRVGGNTGSGVCRTCHNK